VVRTWVDVRFGRHARLHEAHREGDVLVTEHVCGADVDEGRRQPGEVLGSRRGGGVLVRLAVAGE
jgi:hypothetical protein